MGVAATHQKPHQNLHTTTVQIPSLLHLSLLFRIFQASSKLELEFHPLKISPILPSWFRHIYLRGVRGHGAKIWWGVSLKLLPPLGNDFFLPLCRRFNLTSSLGRYTYDYSEGGIVRYHCPCPLPMPVAHARCPCSCPDSVEMEKDHIDEEVELPTSRKK